MHYTVAVAGTETLTHPRPAAIGRPAAARPVCAPPRPPELQLAANQARQCRRRPATRAAGRVAAAATASATGAPRRANLCCNGMRMDVPSDPCAKSDGCFAAV